jgi:uncharacterized membrane protein
MITILPNWHPIFVHFTIGLLGTAVIFYFASALLTKKHKWKQQWKHVADWSLWSGCFVTIFTVSAGWYAYNTVAHDDVSHAAMTLHRDWALATASLFLILGFATVNILKNNKTHRYLFLSTVAIAGAMLMITGYLGGETVYRHGLGVISLPVVQTKEDGHNHHHSLPDDHDEKTDESENHHFGELTSPSDVDSNTTMDKHSHDTETEPTTPHDYHR